METELVLKDEFAALIEDVTCCLVAITNALEAKGLLTRDELREAFLEHLITVKTQAPPSIVDTAPNRFFILQRLSQSKEQNELDWPQR